MRRRWAFFCLVWVLSLPHFSFSKSNCSNSLPERIVVTPRGTERTASSLWLQESKKFLRPAQYTISIEKGDTVYSLSKKYKVSMRDIIDYNHLHPPFGLRVGESLTLSNPKVHQVLKGETLYSIANQRSVDVSALAHSNNLKPPFKLSVGQKLVLPSSISLSDCVGDTTKVSPKALVSFPKKKVLTQSTPKKKEVVALPSRSSAHFLKPVQGSIVSPFGPLKNGTLNDGINIEAASGCLVKAAENGVVIYRGSDLPSYGNMVLIKHSGGWITTYAHLKSIQVSKGETVKRGQTIGFIGKTGHVKSPQLHFELRRGRTPVNPVPYLSK